MKATDASLHVTIPKELFSKFKIYCVTNEITTKEAVMTAITKYMKEGHNNEK